MTQAGLQRKALDDILADFTKVVELSPRIAPAWFNKGNVLVEMGDYTSAIAAYTRAIELKSDLGEAYYNRGYVYLKLGNQTAGVADLSKAGELGILPAYNLIKRISK
jgi:tetratricopeptide (TPR) repeat protein